VFKSAQFSCLNSLDRSWSDFSLCRYIYLLWYWILLGVFCSIPFLGSS